jgi:hypothetical protein
MPDRHVGVMDHARVRCAVTSLMRALTPNRAVKTLYQELGRRPRIGKESGDE